jgi:O-antigen/teichoic acid export membrane protein
MLTANEIGMNYLIISVGSLVSLFDFGFSPQFGRNISYVFGGAQKLQKEGFDESSKVNDVNYQLLGVMIKTAQYVFACLAIVVLVIMVSFGTFYIYLVTNVFSNVENSALIWVLFSISVFFNILYSYYTSLLIGKGLIKESNQAIVSSKIVQIALIIFLLFAGYGLLGVVLANLISPFVGRYLSFNFFFTSDLNSEISKFTIKNSDLMEQFKIVWFNSKKLGLVFLGAHAINKLGIFLAGLYLSLSEIASYGLMLQLFGLVTTFSGVFFSTYQPRFAYLRVSKDKKTLIKEFALSMNLFYILFLLGVFGLIFFGPLLLHIIGSRVILPSKVILIVFSIVLLLESNHSNFATFIVTNNKVPFVSSSVISGAFITLGSFIILKYTIFGVLGLVCVQGVVQLCYNNWKWPLVVLNDLGINFKSFLTIGIQESLKIIKLRSND